VTSQENKRRTLQALSSVSLLENSHGVRKRKGEGRSSISRELEEEEEEEKRREAYLAFPQFRVKDMIIMSLFTALILLPCLLLMHAPSLVIVHNALANRLNKSTGNTGKIDLVKAVVPAYDWVNITAIDEEYPEA
jgi:hypothetical protein